MTGKERVAIALALGTPDRVPFGEYAIDYDTVERIIGHETYVRAKARCQVAVWEGRRDEMVQSLIEDGIALFRALDDVVDIINLHSLWFAEVPGKDEPVVAPRRLDDTTWEYANGAILKYSDVTGDFTVVHDPEKWTRQYRAEDFSLEPNGEPVDESRYEVVDAIIAEFSRDKFIIGGFPMAVELPLLGDMERGLYEMATAPEVVARYAESSLAWARAQQRLWRNRGYDAAIDGTDLSSQRQPLISPAMFQRFCFPNLKANVEAVHAHGLRFIQHACGHNWPLLDAFMEAGVDCYQSVQESAGMVPGEVKKYCQGRMAIWGGVRVENLVSGSSEDVRDDVRRAMATAKPGGGYVFGSSHSIAVGTKYDNFMAMLDEFVRWRDY